MKRILFPLLFALLTSHVMAKDEAISYEPPALTPEVAARYVVHAMIASNSYHKSDRVKFPVETLGWIQVDLDGKPTDRPTKVMKSGLAYDIFAKENTHEIIFAFRGTDSFLSDGIWANFAVPPLNVQYKQARRELAEYLKRHPDKKVTVTGHSLGGGLALCMSVRYGVDAVVFDSSPRIFDGLGDKHLPATRVMVYQRGEILEKVRKFWMKLFEAVSPENIYTASFDFGKANRHRSDQLARGLLDLGETADDTLEEVIKALPK
jgi:outer membrane protein OmpA-like peptidoglycan-associated protein